MKVNVPSSRKTEIYQIDTVKWTCTCKAFKFNHASKSCKHIQAYKDSGGEQPSLEGMTILAPESKQVHKPKVYPVSQDQQQQIKDFDKYTRIRLSEHFILRDFMYSARAEILGLPNRPSDDPEMVVQAGIDLCEKVMEPVYKKFGPVAITYGYQSRVLIEAGYKPCPPTSSAPHQWDRGTFGKQTYARVDITPYSVMDKQHTKYDVGRWMMANLDIDLLMLWHHSNAMCVTIGPKPRRVYLEWVKYGKGDNGSNCITMMGEDYWQNEWPYLPTSECPKYGPSATGGKMSWN